MSLPGFTAEASLNGCQRSGSRSCGRTRFSGSRRDLVEPQISPIAHAICQSCKKYARNESDCDFACNFEFPSITFEGIVN